MKTELWLPVERLRRRWSPERELHELTAKLDPGSDLDSIIRELFSRMVKRVGSIQLDVTEPVEGFIRWEMVKAGSGHRVISVWWVPEPDTRRED